MKVIKFTNLMCLLYGCLIFQFGLLPFGVKAQCLHEFSATESVFIHSESQSNSTSERSSTWFKEVGEEQGILYEGVSYGSCWGDINGDDYPDIFCGNHGTPMIYYNDQENGFIESYVPYYKDTFYFYGPYFLTDEQLDTIDPALVDTLLIPVDLHSGSFVDVDNDGDQDYYSSLGASLGTGQKSNVLFLNENNDLVFQNASIELSLDYEYGRGRGVYWFGSK